jgi:3-hydroxyisobutyrate dehydrogenase-like beta-hydroxyacid dehydrogenase
MQHQHIGFIGLGIMGAPMAGHLAAAGYPLSVHDINNNHVNSFSLKYPDVRIGASPQEVAEHSDIVITMLPSGKYVQEVSLGKQGLIHGLAAGAVVLDTSSSEPWLTTGTARVLAEQGIDMVDAPVSGARPGAEKAELVFMAGGEQATIARVTPLLNVMGKHIFHLGPVGSGHSMKCINNLITALTFMATAEGLSIGKKAGLDPEVMIDVINHSTGMSWISQTQFRQHIFNRTFDDAFRLGLMVKDIGIARQLADKLELPLELSATGSRLWQEAQLFAPMDASVSDMVRWLEHLTGTELCP